MLQTVFRQAMPMPRTTTLRREVIRFLVELGYDSTAYLPSDGEPRLSPTERKLIDRLLDEIPALAVAAALADGETLISGAAELRVKEVDRLAALAGELVKLGVRLTEAPDGLRIAGGGQLKAAVVSSRGDHRMAMGLAIAGLFAKGETRVQDVACVETSFPGFARLLAEAAPGCDIREVTEA